MGRKNPDRVRSPPSALEALTLGQIAASGWTVVAACGRCNTRLKVDARAMAKLLGRDFIIWGRQPRCRVWTGYGDDNVCPGRVRFHANAIAGGQWIEMRMSGDVEIALDFRRQMEANRSVVRPLPSDEQSG